MVKSSRLVLVINLKGDKKVPKFKILFSFDTDRTLLKSTAYVEKLVRLWNELASKKDDSGNELYEPLSGNIFEVINVEYKDKDSFFKTKTMFEGQYKKSSYSKFHSGLVPTPLAFKHYCDDQHYALNCELVEPVEEV